MQYLTELFRIEFSYEDISPSLLALTIKSVSPTTLGVKCANCQFKNGIITNMLYRQLSCSLGQSCLAFKLLGPSFFHKSIQTASTQHGLCQIHDHLITACRSIVLDLLIQCCPPLEEILRWAYVIFLNLEGVSLGILVCGVNGDLEGEKTALHPLMPNSVKLRLLPQPQLRARTYAETNPSAQRATQLRSVLARV
jgi:hypothetical protein